MIEELFTELFQINKYLIKISNKTHCNWTIYIYKNEHIQIDINTEKSLSAHKIDIANMVKYILEDLTPIKITYTCYHDDYVEYNKSISEIIEKIEKNLNDIKKPIIIKHKVY